MSVIASSSASWRSRCCWAVGKRRRGFTEERVKWVVEVMGFSPDDVDSRGKGL